MKEDKIIDVPENDIFGILDPEPIPTYDWLLYVALFFVSLLLVTVFFYWRGKRKKKEEVLLSPYQEAILALEKIADSMMAMDDKEFSIQISEILRTYLEDELEFASSDRTTEEFLSLLQQNSRIQERVGEELQSFMVVCDQVKFANQSLGISKKNELHLIASQIVQRLSAESTEVVEAPIPPPLPKQ